jgi:hypothetical protein
LNSFVASFTVTEGDAPLPTPTPSDNNITAMAGENGRISPSGVVTVTTGGNQVFEIIPDTGYEVDEVMVDGFNVGAVTSYAFTNINASHSIQAYFKEATYTPPEPTPSATPEPTPMPDRPSRPPYPTPYPPASTPTPIQPTATPATSTPISNPGTTSEISASDPTGTPVPTEPPISTTEQTSQASDIAVNGQIITAYPDADGVYRFTLNDIQSINGIVEVVIEDSGSDILVYIPIDLLGSNDLVIRGLSARTPGMPQTITGSMQLPANTLSSLTELYGNTLIVSLSGEQGFLIRFE